MRRERKSKPNILIFIVAALLCATLFSMYFVGGLYARYSTTVSGGDSARIAAFVFVVEDGSTENTYIDLRKIKQPGDKADYIFTVNNFNGGSVSETALEYTISLQLNGSMPLTCSITEITEADEKSVLQVKTVSETDPLTLPLTAKSSSQKFSPAQMKTYSYKLTVEWPIALNDAKYASGSAVAEVILTVSAQQVD